ncbi:tetratricopeptide repeat protein [Nostoc sp. TCL26-01]|uniref:caspase, EACC1-associated type n=1 Tax=Nostoc sp. TCL26-01 TaxID=2576904 RepID=UPI0015BF9B60|nr:tetratricopeptide repeat protein [Nostoc sp. TCL26-01]QLE56662.1 tetratricopeptide repeat protein [Nostoc sp. TCL26-01]
MVKVALLIGVSEYESGFKELPAAVKDIEAMQRVLKDPEMGEFDEVKTLPNPDKQTMESEIETWFSGRDREDLVLLFFSGHGVKDGGNNLYFATRNTRKNVKGELIRSTAVPANFVHQIMNISRVKRQAIILDCCFSGAFDPALQAKDDGSVDVQNLGAEGRVVLTSSSSTQYSFEQKGSDLSIYTRYLVEGIETGAGDRNEDGFVSVLELHEYATSKVQETAPDMTPKIITLKDKGFEIVLSKAKLADPKLRYRKIASLYATTGKIRPAYRAILNDHKQKLGLSPEDVAEIEAELLRPYQERLANLKEYREILIAEAEEEYPLSEKTSEAMNELQRLKGLRDEDVLLIKQEVEAQFAQKSESYQQNLAQYKQVFTEAIQREFPLNQQSRQQLDNLQKSLELKNEDISSVEQPLLQQAEIRYQENLKQQEQNELQRQAVINHQAELKQKDQPKQQQQEKSREQNAIAHNDLGVDLYNQNKLNEAIAEYRKAIELDPNFALAHVNLGVALKAQGKLDEAITAYRQAIKIDPNSRNAHYNLGISLKAQGKLDEAIAAYRQAIKIDPNYVNAHHNLGITLKAQGRLDEAIAAYRQAIKIDPNFALAHNGLGDALDDQGKLDEAIAAYRQAIEIDPNYLDAHYNLGISLKAQGKLDGAIAAYRQAIEIDPNYVNAHHNLGISLKAQGKLDEAIAAYRQAIKINPNVAIAHNGLGDALDDQGKLDEAIAAYRQAIQLDPNLANAHYNLGISLKAQGKLDEAITAYRQAIQLDPNFANAHNNLGVALKAQGKLDEAIAAYRQAIKIDPNFAIAHNGLGATLADQGKWDEAITAYRQAIKIDPNYATAHNNLKVALKAQGEKKKFLGLF